MTEEDARLISLILAREEYKGQTAPLLVTKTAKRYYDWLRGDFAKALGDTNGRS
jgi:hypothetical protein|tara:strand:+ start:23 stop:184 length:162 start_codon:yes stop_codon:yes gene_type:complete